MLPTTPIAALPFGTPIWTAAFEVVAGVVEVLGTVALEAPGVLVPAEVVAAMDRVVVDRALSTLLKDLVSVDEATVELAAVLWEELEDQRLTTLKPSKSREDCLVKSLVALPTSSPLHWLFGKSSMLMPVSPWESILKTWPFGLSISMQLLGPWPVRLCFSLSASFQVISHAPVTGRREMAEIARGRTVDHFILFFDTGV